MAQTIEGFVGKALDDAKISQMHVKVVALIAAGYFFDVIDLIVLGSLIPDMIQSKFATGAEAALVGSATVFGMFIGAAGQGEFSDRWGRKTVYQFNLLLFGVFTILGALAPTVFWLMVCRFIAGLGLGGEQPLAFAYAGEYSPKLIRGRILAIVHFIGGACVWPIASLFTLTLPRCDRLARRMDCHWYRRADRLAVPLLAAGVPSLSGNSRPWEGGSRRSRPHGNCRAEGTTHNQRCKRHRDLIRLCSSSRCSRGA